MIMLGHHCVAILLAKMLIWAPFSQSMCTFFSVLTPAVTHVLPTKTSKFSGESMLHILPSRNKTLVVRVKNQAKADAKDFKPYLILLQVICPRF